MATTAPAPAPVAPAVPRRARRSGTAQDRRTELVLALVAATVLALCAGMLVFVFVKAWPSFEANGLSWFGDGRPPTRRTTSTRSARCR
ncbi:MAG: hypothetical protein MUC67_13705 [Acidobacteria bacterium]|nr:hypothetical protein [Acidobacteriota bacterium]